MVSKETYSRRRKRPPKPLDAASLRDLALSYVARFSTSSAKLESYLHRKIRERGVVDDAEPLDVRAVVERLVELKYVDDEAYASARAGGLLRRGYGRRRIDQTLHHAGIDEGLRSAVAPSASEARHAALALARRRGFGPFGREPIERDKQEKQIAAMLRAGHSFDAARALIKAQSQAEAEEWAHEEDG